MTRGKHGQAAAVRHEVQSAQETIETYQRRVKSLTDQVAKLKSAALEKGRAHSIEIRRLCAERDEGVAPVVRVLERENREYREGKDRAERDRRDTIRRWHAASGRMMDHFKGEHGLTNLEAIEMLMQLVGGEAVRMLDGSTEGHTPADDKRVDTLQRIRRVRR